eukprot:Sspe_Gene.110109::Locus_90443_Transcript_1_1_Confidence_1.000_Length_1157::g.110109::m.110109
MMSAVLWVVVILVGVRGEVVTVHNDQPRLAPDGLPIRASDGCLRQFGKRFYYYGTHYQPCPREDEKYCYEWGANITWPMCGWRNMTFAVYSSVDLTNWELENGDLLPEMHTHPAYNTGNAAFFEPSVEYNAKYGYHVLWFVMQLNGARNTTGRRGGQGVAISRSGPAGPFALFLDNGFPVVQGLPSADLYLWVDSTGTAYMKHNLGSPPHGNFVSRLTENYTAIAETSPPIENGTYYEGGGIFERDGVWYVMFGKGCCFCSRGGSSRVYVARGPLGPYTFQSEVNPILPNGTYTIPAQQFGVSRVVTASGVSQYWYTGMRYGSGEVKTFDQQYWAPLRFATNGSVLRMAWEGYFDVDLP